MNDREFLEGIKNGAMSIEDGLEYMKDSNYKDLGFAKIDFDRKKEDICLRSYLHRVSLMNI